MLKSDDFTDLPKILSASFQHVNLRDNLLLFAELEVLHQQLMLKTVDGIRDLCFILVRKTRL